MCKGNEGVDLAHTKGRSNGKGLPTHKRVYSKPLVISPMHLLVVVVHLQNNTPPGKKKYYTPVRHPSEESSSHLQPYSIKIRWGVEMLWVAVWKPFFLLVPCCRFYGLLLLHSCQTELFHWENTHKFDTWCYLRPGATLRKLLCPWRRRRKETLCWGKKGHHGSSGGSKDHVKLRSSSEMGLHAHVKVLGLIACGSFTFYWTSTPTFTYILFGCASCI